MQAAGGQAVEVGVPRDLEQDVAELLGIPPGVTQIALLLVAYTTTTSFRPAARPPVEDITYYERWGQPR